MRSAVRCREWLMMGKDKYLYRHVTRRVYFRMTEVDKVDGVPETEEGRRLSPTPLAANEAVRSDLPGRVVPERPLSP
jgi:hypothetical protein